MKDDKYVVCDLDGTLCDHSDRIYLAWLGEWDSYNGGCIVDTPNMPCLDFITFLGRKEYKIIFLTGRADKFVKHTVEWLRKYVFFDFFLIMRGDKDFRSSGEFKKHALLDFCVKNDILVSQIEYAIDDNDDCVAMFKDLNIKKVIKYK